MHGVGVIGVLVKDVALEGEVELLLSQGIHHVGERLVQAAEVNRKLVTLEGMAMKSSRSVLFFIDFYMQTFY